MDLCMNHLEEDEDDEKYAGYQSVHLANFITDTMSLTPCVVVTHINAQSHVYNQKNLKTFDRILKINNKKLKVLQNLQKKIVENLKDYIKIETHNDKHTFCVKALKLQEKRDSKKRQYPVEKLVLSKKRKFMLMYDILF